MTKDKLLTPSFCHILAANFLLFFSFYLLLPVLPFYLREVFAAGNSLVGVVLSCYTIACLCVRPFSGYLLDTFSRKPLYLLSYFTFTVIYGGYMAAATLGLFVALQAFHGLAFGMVSVSGNTIVIDILPSSRRGEGVGYYGLANNLAMSFGPMAGLFMHDTCPYWVIFGSSLASASLGLAMAAMVKTPYKAPVRREPLSLDRFFLVKGIPAGTSLFLLSVPYGMVSSYVAVYAKEIGIEASPGLYFTFMAAGMAVSRMFSGRQVDKGRVTLVISLGMALAVATFFGLAACEGLMRWNPHFTSGLYLGVALAQGVSFGTMFPAFNTLFINLAPNSQRGTATSTYLTCWDVGVGIGLLCGGYIAEAFGGFGRAYLFGACLTVVSTVFFLAKAGPHFNRNKVR